ncbi:hypothetical protein KI387_044691, partial [Taxus chinensis]
VLDFELRVPGNGATDVGVVDGLNRYGLAVKQQISLSNANYFPGVPNSPRNGTTDVGVFDG